MTYFIDHFKKSWFFFFLISSRIIKVSINFFLSLMYEILSLFFYLLINVIKLLVWVFVHLYFYKRAIFDSKKKHKNPLEKKGFGEQSSRISKISQMKNIWCFGLDKNLVYISSKKPDSKSNWVKVQFRNFDGMRVETYVIIRPFLEEFLETVF